MNDLPGLVFVVKVRARTPEELIAGLAQVVAQLESDVERLHEAEALDRARLRAQYAAATDPCLN